jgi:hypothetical protein
MTRIAALIAFAALAVPAAAVADDPQPVSPAQTANATCKAELAALGADTFRLTYGTNVNHANAWGRCVSKHAASAEDAADNPAKQCKAEQARLGADAFAARYGSNGNGRNAFGKCVSQKGQDAAEDETASDVSAAKSCKSERSADRAAFAKKYGTFGKCVSAKAKT